MLLETCLSYMRENEPYTGEFIEGLRGLCDKARFLYDLNGEGFYSLADAAERLYSSSEEVREFVDRLRAETVPPMTAVWVDRNRFYLFERGNDVDVDVDRTAPCVRAEMRYLEISERDALRKQAFAEFRARIEPLISVRGWNTFTIDDLSRAWDADRGDVRAALSVLQSGVFEDLSVLSLLAGEYVIQRVNRGAP